MAPLNCMLSTSASGFLLMMLSAAILNVQLAVLQNLAEAGWPDLLMIGSSTGLMALGVAIWMAVRRPQVPETVDCKWVFFAGSAFAGSFGFMMLAVRTGMSLGDFASLNSTNVVFAALMGRLVLKEPLKLPHVMAMLSSVVGSLLISKPAMVFGNSSAESFHWSAYVLALTSGLCDGCIYICSRRLSEVHPSYLLFSFNMQGTMAVLGSAALTEGAMNANMLIQHSVEASLWLSGLFCTGSTSLAAFTLASQWCPAAASATTDTATRMVIGYAEQALLGGAPLDPIKLAGAGLMLLGVAVMALARRETESCDAELPEDRSGEQEVRSRSDAEGAEVRSAGEDVASDTASLASFIASEFADASPSGWNASVLRLRRHGGPTEAARTGGCDSSAQVIGALSTAIAATVIPPTSA